jgi:histidyl-tRNA synthetase
MSQRFQAVRGTRDILPGEVERWQFLEATTHDVFRRYGFQELRTPAFESTDLFRRSVGESSDIVRKEMYTFDSGDDSLTLRPEGTAPLVRAFIQHSAYREIAAGYPARYYYLGPMFRRERPQKGRQRQFHQIGVEVLGAAEPLVDAETLQMLELFLDRLGIGDRELLLSSVGDEACRPAYRAALVEWLEPRLDRLCADCRRRFDENPFRVFDCKVEDDQRVLAEAPTMLDRLCGDCDDHFSEVRRILDRFGVAHRIEPRMVRGLDYYRRTVFEVIGAGLGAQNAILGGGRYDGLVEELGGPALPGFGCAIGMERLGMSMPDEKIPRPEIDLALVALGPEGFDACIDMARRLRASGLEVSAPLVERPMGAQLKRARRSGARFALFVGSDELTKGRFGLKDLDSGEQEDLDESQAIERIRRADEGRP